MTFQQARAISQTNNLHIRRTSWDADKWFMLWRGTWFVFGTGILQPVRATDYTSADLLAADWTTVPAPLAFCPITPGEPSGGSDPKPGRFPFPNDPSFFPPDPSAPARGSSSNSLPTPETGTSLRVRIEDIRGSDLSQCAALGVDFNRTYTLTPEGPSSWSQRFTTGHYIGYDFHGEPNPDDDLGPAKFVIFVTATLPPTKYNVQIDTDGFAYIALLGGFRTPTGGEKPRQTPIDNDLTLPTSGHDLVGTFFYGGQATVL